MSGEYEPKEEIEITPEMVERAKSVLLAWLDDYFYERASDPGSLAEAVLSAALAGCRGQAQGGQSLNGELIDRACKQAIDIGRPDIAGWLYLIDHSAFSTPKNVSRPAFST